MTSLTSTSSSLSMTLSCASCARGATNVASSSLAWRAGPSLSRRRPCRAKSLPRLRRRCAISGAFAWLSSPSRRLRVAFAIRLIVATSTSVASVASVAFVGASCTFFVGGGDRDRCDYCHRRHRCDDTSDSCRVVCAREVAREPFLLATVFARRRSYRRRVGMRLVSTAPLAVIVTDFYVALTLVGLDNCRPRGAFLRSPIATQSPFC